MIISRLMGSRIALSMIMISTLVVQVQPTYAANTRFESLSDLQGRQFFLGNTLFVDSEFCWSSKKPNPKYPRLIEVKLSGKWTPVGQSRYRKDSSRCSDSKYPFLKTYSWKIDRTGNLQLRNREKSPAITATIQVSKQESFETTNSSDIQFLYSTGACGNQLGFARFDESGRLLSRKTIIESKENSQLITQDYDNGVLLFSTFNCDTNETKLYKLGIANKSLFPTEILALPKGSLLIDAAWDVATGSPIALLSLDAASEFVVVTADYSKTLLWSSTEQGWARQGIYPQALISSTGREFTVFGNNLRRGGWTSAQVNFGASRYGRETQYFGSGEIIDVTHGILNMPYALALDSGVYLCRDFPASGILKSTTPREESEDCTLVDSNKARWRGSLAFSFVKGASKNASHQILINSQRGVGYVFANGPILGEWNKIRLSSTLNLNTYEFTAVTRTFELFFDIAYSAPTLDLKDGYFSR